jgi:hypothetical protein
MLDLQDFSVRLGTKQANVLHRSILVGCPINCLVALAIGMRDYTIAKATAGCFAVANGGHHPMRPSRSTQRAGSVLHRSHAAYGEEADKRPR